MARFSDEPIKNPLSGNEVIPATDPSNDMDCGMTPLIITAFAQEHMTVASGTSNGLISAAQIAKLDALNTQSENDAVTLQLAEVEIPIFIGSTTDGFIEIYSHGLAIPWLMVSMFNKVAAGSTNLTLTKNGTPMSGVTNVPITSAGVGSSFSGSPALITFNSNDLLGVTLAGTTGNCKNLIIGINAQAQITP